MVDMFKKIYLSTVLFVSSLLVACSSSIKNVTETELGQVIDLKTNKVIPLSQFVDTLSKAPHILVGEEHDNLKHHQAQHWLLSQLQKQRPQGSLLLEMLSVDQQPLVDQIEQSKRSVSLDNLPKQLNWQRGWNWAFYGELLEFALLNSTKLVATNLTKDEVVALMKGAEPLKGYQSTTAQVKEKLANLITAHHPIDEAHLVKMVEVQQFRDRRMAEKVLQAKTPSVLIAGNHHVNRQYGVPLHLQDLTKNQPLAAVEKMAVVMMKTSRQGVTAEQADYVWILQK